MISKFINLDANDLDWCLEYAEKIVAHYGKKGDKGSGYEDYLNPNPNGDIEIFAKGLEIKGLRPIHWDKFKRCIPPRQLEKYIKNDAIAVWAVTTGDIENSQVELKGWNYCWEVKEYGEFILFALIFG